MAKKISLTVLVLIIILLIPFLVKDRTPRPLVGPALNELTYTEISFNNPYDDTALAGMLFVPEQDEPFPIAVIIHGSGNSFRNNAWYLSVAKHLQDNGVGVLLPDKRGCEKSGGTWIGADFITLATDTESAIAYLKNNGQINCTEIGIIGMSQGGWIAPVMASKSQDLSFVISMSGAIVTTDEQLLFEEYHNIAPYTYNALAKLISPITTKNLKKKIAVGAFMGFDPIPYWKKTTAPVFIAFGENDTNCPVEASIERITANNLDHFKHKVYPDGGHGILDASTHKVSADFLNDLSAFIFDNTTNMNLDNSAEVFDKQTE